MPYVSGGFAAATNNPAQADNIKPDTPNLAKEDTIRNGTINPGSGTEGPTRPESGQLFPRGK